MTNVMAFTVGGDRERIYICSDSQSSDRIHGRKYPAQKLFTAGDTLFACSGYRPKILQLKGAVRGVGDNPSPSEVGERMLEEGRKMGFDVADPDDRLAAAVVGIENGEPVLYHVYVSGNENTKPYMHRQDHTFIGSGGHDVIPAFERDIRTGTVAMTDLAEGMAACFGYGTVADVGIFVDDKMQIGLVGSDVTRLLYHPQMPWGGDADVHDYLAYQRLSLDLTDLGDWNEFSDIPEQELDRLSDAYSMLNDLYHALHVSCTNMQQQAAEFNRNNTLAANVKHERDSYMQKASEALARRDAYKARVEALVSAWVSGDAGKIAEAIELYTKHRRALHESAISYVSQKHRTEGQLILEV